MPDLQSLFSHIYDSTWGVLLEMPKPQNSTTRIYVSVKRYAASTAFQIPGTLPLHMQTAQCKLSFMDTAQELNAGNRYRYLLLRLAESTSVSPRARENARLEVGIRSGSSLTGNGNRYAPVTCKPLLIRSDTMQINSLLDPLDSTVANRPHFFSTFGRKVGP